MKFSGQIKSTEVLYKHRLQMNEGAALPMTPETPQTIDTPQIPHGGTQVLSEHSPATDGTKIAATPNAENAS